MIHMKPVIVCAMDGEFRRSELLNSRRQEVNFETGTMIARSYKGRTLHMRVVYMTNRMRRILIEWKAEQQKLKKLKTSRCLSATRISKTAGIRSGKKSEDLI